uniref:Uncharacterized protein n=1 Tax=Triticum urartu TaxID=4572 RepID=A0A8R7R677_TRIUA
MISASALFPILLHESVSSDFILVIPLGNLAFPASKCINFSSLRMLGGSSFTFVDLTSSVSRHLSSPICVGSSLTSVPLRFKYLRSSSL